MKLSEVIVLAIVLALSVTFIIVILSANIPTWLKWMILFK